MNKFTAAANMAFFLLEQTGSIFGRWSGRMSAAQQRELFGVYLGKGHLIIDGVTETVQHLVKVCFGLDTETTFAATWANLHAVFARMAEERALRKSAHAARRAAQFSTI